MLRKFIYLIHTRDYNIREAMENETLQCYNRGCGQKYDPNKNNDGKFLFWLKHI